MVEIVRFRDEGLGNSSYLVDLGDGRGLVLDPTREPGRYLAAAGRRGVYYPRARTLGIVMALVPRLLLLLAIAWVIGLTEPLFEIFGQGFSGRTHALAFVLRAKSWAPHSA